MWSSSDNVLEIVLQIIFESRKATYGICIVDGDHATHTMVHFFGFRRGAQMKHRITPSGEIFTWELRHIGMRRYRILKMRRNSIQRSVMSTFLTWVTCYSIPLSFLAWRNYEYGLFKHIVFGISILHHIHLWKSSILL